MTPSARPSLARSTAVMTAGTIVSRATGVLRLAAMAAALGIAESRLTDTYNLANTAPNIIYELVLGGVVTSVFVPVFVEVIEDEDEDEAWRIISSVVTVSLLALAALAAVAILAAPLIAGFYSGRLEGAAQGVQRDAITFLLRLLLPQVVLYGIYFLTAAVVNAHKRFGPPMWTPIVNNLVLIAVFVGFHLAYGRVTLESVTRTQLLIVGLGTTLSVAPMGLLLLPYFGRLGTYRPRVDLRHPAVGKLVRLVPYVLGFVAANQIGYIVIQWLANEQQGGYSAYISAFTFFLMPVGLFVWSITTALVPSLSEHSTRGEWALVRQRLATGIKATIFLMVPTAVVFAQLAPLMTRVLLNHGVATAGSADLVAGVLRLFVLGLVQFSIFQLLVRTLYAMQDARTPFYVNLVVVAANVAFAALLFARFAVEGIAVAQAMANTVGMVGLGAVLARRIGGLELRSIADSVWRVAVAAAAAAGAVAGGRLTLDALAGSALEDGTLVVQIAGLGALVALGAGAFLGVARLARVPELAYVSDIVRRRSAP